MLSTATLDSPLRSHPLSPDYAEHPLHGGIGGPEGASLPTAPAVTRRSATGTSNLLSDEDLLARYRDDRDPQDFAELYRRHSAEVYRYLVRYVGDSVLAEDILQETFLRVHAKCALYRDGWPARPWLYSVAIHRAVDALRRTGRQTLVRLDAPHGEEESSPLVKLLTSSGPGPLEELQEQERQRWVRQSVAQLPEPLRQVLVLAYYQGLTYAEIARLLEIPLGTVKSRLHTAIARLRDAAERTGRP